jgi:hypothetical protein
MRRLTVTVTLNPVFVHLVATTAGFYDRIEVLEVLREDMARGCTLGIARIRLSEGISMETVRSPVHFRILDVFESRGREHVCLVKVSMPDQFRSLLHWTDTEVIWERPLVFTRDTVTFSCTGPEPALDKIVQLSRLLGSVTSAAYEPADYRGYLLLPLLTEKERLVLTTALASGYYEYPRRISATELAKSLGYSKSTAIEYLRRAENKVLAKVCRTGT